MQSVHAKKAKTAMRERAEAARRRDGVRVKNASRIEMPESNRPPPDAGPTPNVWHQRRA